MKEHFVHVMLKYFFTSVFCPSSKEKPILNVKLPESIAYFWGSQRISRVQSKVLQDNEKLDVEY